MKTHNIRLRIIYNLQSAILKHSEWVNIDLRHFVLNHDDFATEGSPKSGQRPTLIEWLQMFFIVHSTKDSTTHSRPLNNVDHCICWTSVKIMRPDWDSNPVPLSFEPQSDRMSHHYKPWRMLWTRIIDSILMWKSLIYYDIVTRDTFWY